MKVLLMTSHTYLVAGSYDAPPIGLYRIKQYLSENDIACDIYDARIATVESIIESIKNGEYNIIGISCTHLHMAEDLSLIHKLKEAAKNKSCLFIAGGHEATYNYEQWLLCGLDIIFLGYAESNLVKVVKYFNEGYSFCMSKLKNVDGVAYSYKGQIHFNQSTPLAQSDFELLSYELMLRTDIPYTSYWESISRDINGLNVCSSTFIPEIVRLYTTSHCPNRCGYCSSHSFLSFSQKKEKTRVLMLSANRIYQLILHYINEYGAKGVLFSDDELFISKKRIVDLSDKIIEAKRKGIVDENFMLNCQARVPDFLINKDGLRQVEVTLLEKISKAGFHVVGMGIETFCARLLGCNSMNKKGFNEEETLDVLDAMLEHGIVPNIFLILFIPEATKTEIIHNMKLGMKLVKKGCQIVVNPLMYALPGAPIYGDPEYPMRTKKIVTPITKEVVEVAEYFIPRDKDIKRYAEKIWVAVEEEIVMFKKSRDWCFSTLPKTVVGILTFIATAKLLGEKGLAGEWYDYILEMLENQK